MDDNKPTLLVVDDEPDLREYFAMEVEFAGMNALTAENGNEALKMLSENIVHGIVSDIRMPGMDGVQLLKEVQKANSFIPFIFATGFAEKHDLESLRDGGALAILQKPIDSRVFSQSIVELAEFGYKMAERHQKASSLGDKAFYSHFVEDYFLLRKQLVLNIQKIMSKNAKAAFR